MKNNNEFILFDKADLKVLSLKDVSIALPDLKNIYEAKALVIANWIIDWIETDYKTGKIKESNLLPKKADFAYHLGVSIGTMQNAFRYVEDKGYVESKQCIGTMIKNWKNPSSSVRKLTSKRDITIELIKKHILESNIKIGQKMPPSRVLARAVGGSSNTTRLALEHLSMTGIIEHTYKSINDANWVLKSNKFTISKTQPDTANNVTLVKKVEKDLEKYIEKNLKIGDKLPAHDELSKALKVSVKTIHDALKGLITRGILFARRGRYGTTVTKMPKDSGQAYKKETSIFASAPETAFYNYEKTQNHIKALIAEKYEIGSKLPSIMDLSKELDLSPNTIRKAFNNLADEGYLRFSRGRYGGTFVIDIPDTSAQSFKWLAVNPKYVEVYK